MRDKMESSEKRQTQQGSDASLAALSNLICMSQRAGVYMGPCAWTEALGDCTIPCNLYAEVSLFASEKGARKLTSCWPCGGPPRVGPAEHSVLSPVQARPTSPGSLPNRAQVASLLAEGALVDTPAHPTGQRY